MFSIKMKSFKKVTVLFLGIVAVFYTLHFSVGLERLQFPEISMAILYIGTLVADSLIEEAFISGQKSFVQLAMGTIIIRITLYTLYIVGMVFLVSADIIPDIVFFATLYLITTVNDIIYLLKRG